MTDWCEEIIGYCPNCNNTVKCVRYNDDAIASGVCDCGTVVVIEV